MGPKSATTMDVTLVECRKTAGWVPRMTLGAPVEPELHTPEPRGAVTTGNGVSGAVTLAQTRSSWSGPTDRVGSRTSRRRLRSQSGRSHRTGTTVAPTFQPANPAS